MSIIYDALQKTQKNRNKSEKPLFLKKVKVSPIWIDIGIMAIITILVVFALVAYTPRVTHYFKTQKTQTKLPDVIQKPAPTAAVTPVIENPILLRQTETQERIAFETAFKNKHILNGVFLSDQDKVALIDNHSFHIGDVVDDMMIVGINVNSIKLQNGKYTIIMQVAA